MLLLNVFPRYCKSQNSAKFYWYSIRKWFRNQSKIYPAFHPIKMRTAWCVALATFTLSCSIQTIYLWAQLNDIKWPCWTGWLTICFIYLYISSSKFFDKLSINCDFLSIYFFQIYMYDSYNIHLFNYSDSNIAVLGVVNRRFFILFKV